MKKFKFAAGLLGLAMLGACSSDAPEVVNNGNQMEDGEAIGYLRINFSNNGTRAENGGTGTDTGTSNATAEECNIQNICFIFHTVSGQYIYRWVGESANLPSGVTASPNIQKVTSENAQGHTGDNCYVIKIQQAVDKVACIVNAASEVTQEGLATRDQSTYARGNKNYFYMSSATVYDDDNNANYYTKISQDNLYTSEEAALKAESEGGSPIVINVERTVAKVTIKNNIALTDGKIDLTDTNNDIVETGCTATFEPQYAVINNKRDKGYTMKQLPEYNSNWSNDVKNWIENTTYCPWVGSVAGSKTTYSYSTLTSAHAYPATTPNVTYQFEARSTNDYEVPALAVVGKFEVTKNGTPVCDDEGTFYLVGFGNKFVAYDNEDDVILAMEGTVGEDTLMPMTTDDKTIATSATSASDWKDYSGYMKLSKTKSVYHCIKYYKGLGYYTTAIQHNKIGDNEFNGIVRNHAYTLAIDKIKGFGVGITKEDQPIVPVNPPTPDDQNFWLHMNVTILPWATVSQSFQWGK